MDDYSKILEKEKKLLNKENLLDDTIVEDKLSKHEIISKMYKGLVSEIEELKSILFKDLIFKNADFNIYNYNFLPAGPRAMRSHPKPSGPGEVLRTPPC